MSISQLEINDVISNYNNQESVKILYTRVM
jgi:hypothetical protein